MIKKNLFYTYFIQIYSGLISVILIPFYLDILSVEQFGLIGFFMLLQSIMMIFDAGISGSLSRQVAITKHNSHLYKDFLNKFYIVIVFFFVIALSIFLISYIENDYIVNNWIKSELSKDTISISVVSMFLILSLKYISGPLRSIIIGLEEHILLSKLNFIFITLKFPMGLFVLYISGASIANYFIFQVAVALFELILLAIIVKNKNKNILKRDDTVENNNKEFTFKSLLIFSGQLSLLSVTWIVVTQIDKLILSGILQLKEFSYYTLAITITGIILMFSTPLSQVMMARLTVLFKNKDLKKYVEVYTFSFSVMIVVTVSLGLFIFTFSKPIIYMWTGNMEITNATFAYAKWLALGNSISVLMTFVFLLQYSAGNLKQHVIVYTAYASLLIPISIYIANTYQGYGSAIFWFIHNFSFFITWGTIVNYKYIKNVNLFLWVYILVPTILISLLFFTSIDFNIELLSSSRINIAIYLSLIGVGNILLITVYYMILERQIKKQFNKIEFRQGKSIE